MNHLPRKLYSFVSALFIVIGLLHLMVHYQDLLEPHLQSSLSHSISVMGNEASVWKMWQGFSFMMGGMMIIIGLFNIAFLRLIPKPTHPPIACIIIMMILLGMVVYSGQHFFGPEQFYGGLFGESLMLIALLFSLKKPVVNED